MRISDPDELLKTLLAETAPPLSGKLTGPRPTPKDQSGAELTPPEDVLRRVEIAPVIVKGQSQLQLAYHFPKKVTHRNFLPAAALEPLSLLLRETFTQANFQSGGLDYHLALGRDGRWSVRKTGAAAPVPPPGLDLPPLDGHNRRKNYLLPEGLPVPFLVRLGVMTADGRVVAARYDKFRQINRFLEMVADVLPSLPSSADRPLRIVDFGSGKSYLTFALYHYLHITLGRPVSIVGLDLKRDVIETCNALSADLGWSDNLRFQTGDIASYTATDRAAADMVVSLHACDTATDDALAKAVFWGASVILAVPCCQHELYGKLDSGGPASQVLRPLLKHGIFKERLAALVTDALRAEMLERAGYQVQALEFIDLEHTPKNLLLRAVRRTGTASAQARIDAEYAGFRDFWAIEPYIEGAFGHSHPSHICDANVTALTPALLNERGGTGEAVKAVATESAAAANGISRSGEG